MSDDWKVRFEEKLDKLVEKQHEQNITLARNTESLIIHEKRTDLAETKMALLEKKQDEQAAQQQKMLEPIKKHVDRVNFVLITVVPAVAAGAYWLYKAGFIVLPTLVHP